MNWNDGDTGNGGGEGGSVSDLIGGGDGGGQGGGDAGTGQGGSEQGGGAADAAFLGQFSAETPEGETASMQDWVKASGIKDIAGLAKVARDNQRAVRDGGRIKIPGEGATDQEIAEYRQAIGVPEKPEDYAQPEPKDADGNPIPINTAMTDRIFANAHKLGGSKDLIEKLVAGEIEQQVADYDAAIKEIEGKANEHVKGWGEDKDAKLAQVNAALKELDLSREDVQHMRAMPSGVGKFLDAMAKVGTNFSEGSLVQGDRKSFGMAPEQAQKELDAMKADPVVADKIMVPGSQEYQRYNRLLNIVADAANQATVDN